VSDLERTSLLDGHKPTTTTSSLILWPLMEE
jgi:hypothetical protein